MDFSLTPEQESVRKLVRDFAHRRVAPLVAEYDRDERIPKELVQEAGKLGLTGGVIPPEYGGSGMDYVTLTIVVEEMAKVCQILAISDEKIAARLKIFTEKKAAEKLCLEDKVHVLWGTAGSHLTLIVQQVADQYKTVFMNPMSLTDSLMNGKNFNRYTFRTTITTTQFGHATAYYYSNRPEKKFYILCQDYMFGHEIADAFKAGLKKYKPNAEIVGETFHPLFMKDFAPYMTKIQGSGAEVIYTGDWSPDADNFLKQARGMGVTLPIANIYMDAPGIQEAVGGAGGRGMVNINDHHMTLDTPEMNAFIKIWRKSWEKWNKPYNTVMWEYPLGAGAKTLIMSYWMMDVIERAGSANAEKIIKTWEGDTYKALNGVVHMRACDHQVVRDMYAAEYVFPNQFYKNAAAPGKAVVIPAKFIQPLIPEDLDRCKK